MEHCNNGLEYSYRLIAGFQQLIESHRLLSPLVKAQFSHQDVLTV